ncbi:Hypothetical predicted protein [Pelobates cultripes]|uniref:Uncharacterized protein n=1 Tax=Pelobates cultripes TaxID=61616 RepID=A0AAD1WJQ7_PELCU|nr:Hypothetical predicted protein [Pelobates cultripes]
MTVCEYPIIGKGRGRDQIRCPKCWKRILNRHTAWRISGEKTCIYSFRKI